MSLWLLQVLEQELGCELERKTGKVIGPDISVGACAWEEAGGGSSRPCPILHRVGALHPRLSVSGET